MSEQMLQEELDELHELKTGLNELTGAEALRQELRPKDGSPSRAGSLADCEISYDSLKAWLSSRLSELRQESVPVPQADSQILWDLEQQIAYLETEIGILGPLVAGLEAETDTQALQLCLYELESLLHHWRSIWSTGHAMLELSQHIATASLVAETLLQNLLHQPEKVEDQLESVLEMEEAIKESIALLGRKHQIPSLQAAFTQLVALIDELQDELDDFPIVA